MPIESSQEEPLKWKRDESIDLPIPESEGRLAIRHQDWKRIKTRIQRIDKLGSALSVIYSVLFGIAGSAGLSIIPLTKTTDLSPWVVPLYVCVFGFSLLSGLVFVFVERGLKRKERDTQIEIYEEMCEIEGPFVRKKGGIPTTESKAALVKTNPEGPNLDTSGSAED